MTVIIYKFIEYFIPEQLKIDFYIYNKAKAFVVLFWFVFLLSFTLAILARFSLILNAPNIEFGLILCLLLIWGFKKKGQLILFSNLLVTIYLSILLPSIPFEGGLYSDNLLWTMIAPLIALLFGNKISSFIWFCLIAVFSFLCYYYTDDSASSHFPFVERTPFFLSFILLMLAIYVIVLIFEKGLDLIIEMLQEQKKQLESQKQLLQQQNELLEEQKRIFVIQKNEILKKNSDLELMEEKLIYSNKELENFAYAASHDLKEPLRMIGMYTQLMKRRLVDKLDDSTSEFMFYITDGVSRMQTLLEDLLQYSRLGKKDDGVKIIDLDNVLYIVIHNLTVAMKDANAAIISERLPKAMASQSEMVQLFQNLIANSIKFRRKDVETVIFISVKEFDNYYLFSFQDNGIGINEAYKEKVFNIFERLHSKVEYDGTGIGLATVKKIVTNAGGQIWLNSTEGVGTTFYFKLPRTNEEVLKTINPMAEHPVY